MESPLFWIIAVLVVAAVALVAYSRGTRAATAVIDDCYVSIFWFFGRHVECKGGKSCANGCKLEYRTADMSHWADADATSMKYNPTTQYRCSCR